MQRRLKVSCSLGFLLCFLMQTVVSQDGASDTALWTSIGLNYEPNEQWEFGLEEQLRFKDNIGAIDEYFTELAAEYKLQNGFAIGAGVRYIRENDNRGNIQGYENHFRFQLDASYKHKWNAFSFKHRLRYQNRNELGISQEEGDIARQRLRLKTAIGYNIPNWKLDPKFSAEIFNGFAQGVQSEFNQYRLTLETSYKFKNAGRIRFFYRYEDEFNENNPLAVHILGIGYRISFGKNNFLETKKRISSKKQYHSHKIG